MRTRRRPTDLGFGVGGGQAWYTIEQAALRRRTGLPGIWTSGPDLELSRPDPSKQWKPWLCAEHHRGGQAGARKKKEVERAVGDDELAGRNKEERRDRVPGRGPESCHFAIRVSGQGEQQERRKGPQQYVR